MAEYKRPKNFAEAIAMYTGSPVRETKEREPLTEEEHQKRRELTEKIHSLSKEEFLKQFDLTPPEIIDRVYRQPFPNRFLASLSPFIAQHLEEPAIRQLVLNSFIAFFRRNVMQYDYKQYPVHFIGSIAYCYKEILQDAARQTGIQIGKILQSPMEGLIQYHSQLSFHP